MSENESPTLVIFRKWKTSPKSIVALFPTIPATANGWLCECYEHIGQHGSADPAYVIGVTTPATPDEYADLKAELESIGYNLKIGQKIPRNAFELRKAALNER